MHHKVQFLCRLKSYQKFCVTLALAQENHNLECLGDLSSRSGKFLAINVMDKPFARLSFFIFPLDYLLHLADSHMEGNSLSFECQPEPACFTGI
jgi:hypothetical protein